MHQLSRMRNDCVCLSQVERDNVSVNWSLSYNQKSKHLHNLLKEFMNTYFKIKKGYFCIIENIFMRWDVYFYVCRAAVWWHYKACRLALDPIVKFSQHTVSSRHLRHEMLPYCVLLKDDYISPKWNLPQNEINFGYTIRAK